jgi:hypothetical protein
VGVFGVGFPLSNLGDTMPEGIQGLLQQLAKIAGFKYIDKYEAIALGKCAKCGEEAQANCVTIAGNKEYKISGICEVCFDDMFKDDDNEEKA